MWGAIIILILCFTNIGIILLNKVQDFINKAVYDFKLRNIDSASALNLIQQFGSQKSYVRIYYDFIIKNFSGIGGIKISNITVYLKYKGVLIGKTPQTSDNIRTTILKPVGDTVFSGSIDLFLLPTVAEMILELKTKGRVTLNYEASFSIFGFYTYTLKDSYEYVNNK